MQSVQASLTAVWHVAVGYAVGAAVDHVFTLAKPTASKTNTTVLLETVAQVAVGYAILTEAMTLLVDATGTPIGDGISSTAFILAQPELQDKLKHLRKAILPKAREPKQTAVDPLPAAPAAAKQ
jgi:hypothetical protein